MIQNANVLITGGYGFLGAHIAEQLSAPIADNTVTILDMNFGAMTTGDDLGLSNRPNITLQEGSVTDASSFEGLLTNFDFVVHAAGFLGINAVAQNQLKTMDVNILGTRNTLDFAASHVVKPFTAIFSTSEIYGVEATRPSEDSAAVIQTVGDRWCYATSKLTDEYYLRAYNQSFGLPGVIIRPFNVFGPHRYGTNAMTQLVKRAVAGEPLQISGDGQQVRAWCDVRDFTQGVLSAMEFAPRSSVEAFNVGDDRNVLSMACLAEKIVQIARSTSEIQVLGNTIEDVTLRVPNIDKANVMLGYKPSTHFDDSIKSVVDWTAMQEGRNVDAEVLTIV